MVHPETSPVGREDAPSQVEGVSGRFPPHRYFIAARKALGWSQAELARRSHVRTSTIADFERGKRRLIRANFAAICKALGAAGVQFAVTEDEIVGVRWPK
jgi:ribosome-binding protein aMBF1 (putative translation factor)